MRDLDVEQRREQRLQGQPLIEAQAIDDDEHRGSIAREDRQQKLADDIHGQRRAITFQVVAATPGTRVAMNAANSRCMSAYRPRSDS